MFALVDCNNFYASCERVFQPQFNNVPVAILSNNDGCFISRSDEAKTLGLPMGAPEFKYRKFCEDNKIKVFSSNYPLYGDMSTRVMNILGTFTPDIEVYSIDEAFLKFDGFQHYNFESYGREIQRNVQKCTGIPISIGIAPTKGLAKVANKIAKKLKTKTGGVYVIQSEERRVKALKWTKIESVWGVGRGNLKRLQARNIKTAYDFTQLSDEWVRKQMAIIGLRLKKDLQGIPTLDLDDDTRDKKAIATTRSFEGTYSDMENIKERISTFATSCAEKLRSQGSSCNYLVVLLRSDRHKKDEPQDRSSLIITMPYATDSSLTISNYAVKAAVALFKPGIKYKRAGVIVSGLVPTNERQLDLFLSENPKHHKLMQVMDNINNKYNGHKMKIANQDLKRTWKMRQEHLSPKYTTNINEIIVVK
ncbi:DNA-directed DNA polymerase [Allomuricauda ruestringensis DSM 13258]|uniref:DNA-directed DNA polymerase n=1 Tax=Allomuricauda ruestringensis (strain DSM 13258 / CIP 107369 / LMG 19739 / B1) TaxID=886377 RepID=G2PIW3_ALLRU|nr:Y-family DNA polymerase [Allomuricauda ruestringensis]AEM70762.1 DNA-directed DNA polymerase [Allomuricauda ruestringensis DSM 13258]